MPAECSHPAIRPASREFRPRPWVSDCEDARFDPPTATGSVAAGFGEPQGSSTAEDKRVEIYLYRTEAAVTGMIRPHDAIQTL